MGLIIGRLNESSFFGWLGNYVLKIDTAEDALCIYIGGVGTALRCEIIEQYISSLKSKSSRNEW